MYASDNLSALFLGGSKKLHGLCWGFAAVGILRYEFRYERSSCSHATKTHFLHENISHLFPISFETSRRRCTVGSQTLVFMKICVLVCLQGNKKRRAFRMCQGFLTNECVRAIQTNGNAFHTWLLAWRYSFVEAFSVLPVSLNDNVSTSQSLSYVTFSVLSGGSYSIYIRPEEQGWRRVHATTEFSFTAQASSFQSQPQFVEARPRVQKLRTCIAVSARL